jgi:uncharacterized protein (TIGR00255 family)
MIRSMTGYSRVQHEEGGLSLSVSVRSINHRFLDLQVRLPVALESLEPLVRSLVKQQVTRGHVEIAVVLDRAGAAELHLDRRLLAAYLSAYRDLRAELVSATEPDPLALLRIPGMVVSSDGELPPEEMGRAQQLLERAIREALERLTAMRLREGESLERDVRSRLAHLQELSAGVTDLAERVPRLYEQRLQSRVKELMSSVELDRARLAQEVAYLASRSDISEELTRFRSHLDQVQQLLSEGPEVGKKLDFLLQEMNREANTLLSKTTDVPEVGPEISRRAIEMKTEIEKLREQAQNLA